MNKCLKCKASHAPAQAKLSQRRLRSWCKFQQTLRIRRVAADIRRIQFVCLLALLSCCRQHITKQATSLDYIQRLWPVPLPPRATQRPHLSPYNFNKFGLYFDNLKLCLPRWKIPRLPLALSHFLYLSLFCAVIFIICHTSSSLAHPVPPPSGCRE